MGIPLYDYRRWKNFTKSELVCQHTFLENPNVTEFTYLIDFVQGMRSHFEVPFTVSSGYRHETHPSEVDKDKPGQHQRAAIDIRVPTDIAWQVVYWAMMQGAKGIGIKLHGPRNKRFIHIDFRTGPSRIWSYK